MGVTDIYSGLRLDITFHRGGRRRQLERWSEWINGT